MAAALSATLPLLFLLISLLRFAAMLPLRAAVLKSAIIAGVVVVANTELLSLASLISPLPLAIVWAAECVVAAVFVVRSRAAVGAYLRRFRFPELGATGYAAALGVALIVVTTGVIALVAPPNTYDSMAFHMSRVAHWAADQAVAFYPTNITRQLYEPPWSEFAILQLQVLSGGDRFANLVQWTAMIVCLAGTSRVAQQLGASGRGQVLTVVFVATLPMGILQATSTQTDYVEALWLVCLVSTTIDFVHAPSVAAAFWVGAALGLAALTKGTAYIFAAPLVVGLGVWTVRRLGRRVLAPAAVLIVVPLVINLGQYARNEAVFGNPLADPVDNRAYTNATFAPNAFVSNIVRDSVLQFGTPSSGVNNAVDRVIVALHNSVLHIGVDDSRTTWPDATFTVIATSLDEDYAGDPLQALLAVIAIVAALVLAVRAGQRWLGLYAAGMVVAFLLFAAYLRWQPWHARLELPLMVLAGPLAGLMLSRLKARWLGAAVAAVLIVASVPWVVDNASRPMIGYTIPRTSRDLPQGETIFSASRQAVYFAKRHDLEAPYAAAVARARAAGCGDIGLWSGPADWEYPLWALAGQGTRVDAFMVDNPSSSTPVRGATPCMLVSVAPNQPQTILLDGRMFTMVSDDDGVGVYLPAATSP